jgi:aconitate hydratase
LVLTVTQTLRAYGVVGKIVEFFGPGLSYLSVADRATIGNMSPEYGATAGFFPVDGETLKYLAFTGRKAAQVELVEHYTKEQGLFRTDQTPQPEYADVLELDLATVEPSLAGPKRPQDRIALSAARNAWLQVSKSIGTAENTTEDIRWVGEGGTSSAGPGREGAQVGSAGTTQVPVVVSGRQDFLDHGSVVIAAITSCTNTSNPAVMLSAGILAKKAVKLGLQIPVYIKTSLAPGSRVVTRYLDDSGLTPYLEALGFHLVGYGCTTCIGNSGPLHPEVSRAISERDLTVVSVLSGNRNFEGRIHPEVKANYLASPPLVVAYALAGTMNIDLKRDPIGLDRNEDPVYLKDIWPASEEIEAAVAAHVSPEMFAEEYANVFTGNETWNAVKITESRRYGWDAMSTYIRKPTFFDGLSKELPPLPEIKKARVLALMGDSVTTDHISPAGAIPEDSPAGKWLLAQGVAKEDFNTYGSRRGNHEVMIRGTFGNIRIRNRLVPGMEGGYTRYLPADEQMFIYDAATKYQQDQTPLLVIAGKEYGSGSSRDWAAKGTILLGVKAVIAESFERIHRSNLIGMGVLPLQFKDGENAESLGLTGEESYSLQSVEKPGQELTVTAETKDGAQKQFQAQARLDTPVELNYYRNGGILHTVLRNMA